ncbi:tetratricopeptide repeat-containing sensor histidine kinase [Polaribacter gangjinensis]|uniref:tetratricopeptide repeat-containing sensor histidine kinase n=1 Tax=Polaribacter gangjinensis TaxID=574710 RepID=UPI001475B138|nr:sensor histidine kinase [Polaribacter gangjinensis]
MGLIIIFLFGINPCIAQETNLETLKSSLSKSKSITEKVDLQNEIAFLLYRKDSASTFQYLNEAYKSAKKINYEKGVLTSLKIKAGYFIFKNKGNQAIVALEESKKILLNNKDELQLADVYRELGQAKSTISKYKEAIEDVKRAEKIFIAYKNDSGLEKTYETLGLNYAELGDYETAVSFLFKSLAIKEKIGVKDGMASIYNNIGRQLYNQRNYEEAIKYYDKSAAYSKAAGDEKTYGITLVNSANILISQKNYLEGEKRLLSAIESFEKLKFDRGVQTCYNNLGAIFLRDEKYQKGIDYLKKALIIANKNQNKQGVPLILHNIGYGYRGLKNYEEALKWYEEAEKVATENTADAYTFTEIYKYRAVLDSTRGKFESAYLYKSKYQKLYEKMLNDKSITAVNELKTKYETQKKENEILNLSKQNAQKNLLIVAQKFELSESKLKSAKDSLLLFSQSKELLESKLDASVKEEKINNLSKIALQKEVALQKEKLAVQSKNSTILLISSGSLLMFLIGFGLFRKKKLEQKALLLAEQHKQRELLTQAVIEAEETERKRIAADLHDGVGQLFSAVKMNLNGLLDRIEIKKEEDQFLAEKTMALVDESCKEVRVISHKMMPNFLLKSGIAADIKSFIEKIDENSLKISFESIGFKDQLEFNEEIILYRIIQELVNNVIKHAKANELKIVLEKNAQQILVKISDNGIGFNYQKALEKGGLGLKNMQVRIEYLKGNIHFSELKPHGTEVEINIPIL